MKTTPTFLLLFFASVLFSQPTITSSWAPNTGDMVEDVVGANADLIEPGESGANANWDYSNVMPDPNVPVASFEYADPSVSSSASLFPEATIALIISMGDPNSSPVTFHKESSDRIELLGNALPMVSFVYSDPQTFMKFPFSYNDSFEDDFAAVNDINGIMSYVYGDVKVTADAYGTIKTPKGTFDNVIRIKTETNRKDSTGFAPDSYTLVIQNIVSYIWFKNTIGHNIASLTITNGETVTVAGGMTFSDVLPETRTFSWDNTGGASSLKEINGTLPLSILSYGPNPATDHFSVQVNSACSCPVSMEVTNYAGQIMQSEKFDLFYGNNTLDVSIGDFPAGNYFVKLAHEDGYGVFQIKKMR